MEADQSKVNETPRQGTTGPGERLQAERIKKGLTIEDVANRMHLSTSILKAIEENNFDEITAPIFVKGYLRAYARIVALSEDEMIEQYLVLYSEEDPPINSTSNVVPELSSADTRIKWTTYFVVILLIVLLAGWWWNKQQNQVPPVSLDVPSAAEDELSASEAVVDSEIQAGSESPTGESVVEVESAVEEVALTNTEEASVSVAGTEEDTEAEENIVESDAVEVETVEPAVESSDATEQSGAIETPAEVVVESIETEAAAPAEITVASDTEPVAEAPVAGTRQLPGVLAPSGSDKLRIVVHADTWTDVKDANNYQLIYDLLRANNTVELSGQAPFVVFLGNGHGVEIRFNGEQVGFAAQIRDDNTARISIGG